MTKRPGRRGMSIIETLAVVAIIGLMSALAAPNLIRLVRNSRVVADARELQTVLTSLRAQAMTRGFPMVLCLRGRAWVGAEGIPRQAIGFRKGTPLLPPPCVSVPCPAMVVDPSIPDFAPGGTPADTRSVEQILTEQVSWTLPTADTRTFQLVFDMEGRVTGWESDNCTGSVHTVVAPAALAAPMSGNGWTFLMTYDGAPTPITQAVAIRPDGTVFLP